MIFAPCMNILSIIEGGFLYFVLARYFGIYAIQLCEPVPGKFLGIVGQDCCDSKSNRLLGVVKDALRTNTIFTMAFKRRLEFFYFQLVKC